jgi:hypothetical protein
MISYVSMPEFLVQIRSLLFFLKLYREFNFNREFGNFEILRLPYICDSGQKS